MGKDILHRVGNGGHCGCETVSREVLPQVEISEKWTQEPPCFAITIWCAIKIAHQWQHNGNDSVSNHQPHDCLLNCLFRRRWKNTSKLRVTGLCVVNSSVIGEFSAQMASNAENVSIWWRHNEARSSREWQSEVEDLLWNCGTLICPAENPTGLNLIYQLHCTYWYWEIRKHRIKLRAQDPLPYHLVICFVDF